MNSIRTQVLGFIAVILLILLVVLNVYPLVSARDLVFTEKENAMSAQASVISSSLSGLDRLTSGGVREVLSFLEVSGYDRTVVASEEGRVIYDDGGAAGVMAEDPDIMTALGGKTVFRSSFKDDAFRSVCVMPISRQGVITGALYISEEDTERAGIILDVQSRIRVISGIVAILAIAAALFFVLNLTDRIKILVDSMRTVAGGDYAHRLKMRGKDEIAELGDEFNKLTERLDETEKQRRRFVSDASHELKTPLASIRLLSDSVLQNENIEPAVMREFVSDIGHEAERLQRTTEELLDLSRLDDDIQVMREPVDVKQVALDAYALAKPLAEDKDIRIKLDLQDGCVVMATADDMYHIIFNLLENAVKYNNPGGSVDLIIENKGDTVEITVADTGIGIPEEDRLNVFTRFYRVDKARSRASGGTGLGLSIVHDAVHVHGGTITIGANKPQGSIFIVSFPAARQEDTGI